MQHFAGRLLDICITPRYDCAINQTPRRAVRPERNLNMKKQDIIQYATREIRRNAYTARICEELKGLGFDAGMMEYHENINNGKAFGMMEMLRYVTGEAADVIYQDANDEAIADIRKANYDTVELLNMAGFDGPAYYAVETRHA